MKRLGTVTVAAVLMAWGLGLACVDARAETVHLKVKPGEVLNPIDVKIYGHFLEHIYHSCDGGLWGELVWNRSFEENLAGGQWVIDGQEIVQPGGGINRRLVFGNREWKNYEYALEARKTGGHEGFLVLFRVNSDKEFYWLNLGGWGNTQHGVERGTKSQDRWGIVGPTVKGQIKRERWYQIKVRVEGRHVQAWLDGEKVIDFTDDQEGHLSGAIGVGTWETQARYRNIRVTSLDGEVLYKGVPEVELYKGGPEADVEPMKVRHWSTYGPGKASLEHGDALNCDFSTRIRAGDAETGLQQKPFCVERSETYGGSLWACGDGTLLVRLLDGETVLAQASGGPVDGEWREFAFQLDPAADAENATLQVGVQPGGDVRIDQVSMMPDSWRAAGGFRPDLVQAIKDLKPPVIRWPGGCFASAYRWKQGIGPQHKREVHPLEIWDQKDVYSMGTDEFIRLCRMVGAEPIIVVNIGTPQWGGPGREKEFDQEVLDWIEYCNGPKDSKWGKVRAENGHPEPYNVKYWEIDNEVWRMGGGNYANRVNHLAPLMRKTDPSIKLIACGSGGYGEGGTGFAFNRAVIEGCADQVDYLSIHHYEAPNRFADGPGVYENFIRRTHELIKKSKNPDLKIYCSEWNAQSTDWRTGLYCGGLLNAFERCGDYFTIGGPALFLRHVSATAWDNAFINFDHRTWFPAPNYVVMKLWREHYQPERIGLEGETGPLNIVATKSENGKTACLKVVNPSDELITLRLAMDSPFEIGGATAEQVAPAALHSRNTLEDPHAVQSKPINVSVEGRQVSVVLPAYSATVVNVGG